MLIPKKIFGFSVVEVLISMMILGLGITAYVQSTISNLATNTDTTESHRATMVSSELARIFTAHVAHLGVHATQSQIESSVSTLRSEILSKYRSLAEKRGYVCDGYVPRITGPSTVNPNDIQSTLEHLWLIAPPGCLDVHILNNPNSNSKGVWIESKLKWLSLKDTRDHPQGTSTVALITPMINSCYEYYPAQPNNALIID